RPHDDAREVEDADAGERTVGELGAHAKEERFVVLRERRNPPCPPLPKGGNSRGAERPPLKKRGWGGSSRCDRIPPLAEGGEGGFAVRVTIPPTSPIATRPRRCTQCGRSAPASSSRCRTRRATTTTAVSRSAAGAPV